MLIWRQTSFHTASLLTKTRDWSWKWYHLYNQTKILTILPSLTFACIDVTFHYFYTFIQNSVWVKGEIKKWVKDCFIMQQKMFSSRWLKGVQEFWKQPSGLFQRLLSNHSSRETDGYLCDSDVMVIHKYNNISFM